MGFCDSLYILGHISDPTFKRIPTLNFIKNVDAWETSSTEIWPQMQSEDKLDVTKIGNLDKTAKDDNLTKFVEVQPEQIITDSISAVIR
ncbi:hypothetical protein A3Q56_06783 [Intoshia linei]|uniref:Uncharacterized protein n=1 Tax=Intoshia linei TaxID=1819745 RepID=A0A177AVV0_9BILA|nr:hypothetical protein A3Q56_06783 [Intoshia linei]